MEIFFYRCKYSEQQNNSDYVYMDQMLILNTAENLNNEMIVVGDFNLVIDLAKDYYNYLHVNNPKAREAVLDQMNICNLADVNTPS